MLLNRPIIVWFLSGAALIGAAQCAYMLLRGGDVTRLLQVGVDSPSRPLLENELGPMTVVRGLGHDGKYHYLMARQPWFWCADPNTIAVIEDPAYRYGRPLFSILAGFGGILPPRATMAAMIAIQLLSGGLYLSALVWIARTYRLPTSFVVIGMLNPGIYSSAVMLTCDLPALALALTGVVCWQSRRNALAILLYGAAVFTKEYYAIVPLGLAMSLAMQRRPIAFVVGVTPLLPVFLWRFALWQVFGAGSGEGNFSWPGQGFAVAAANWRYDAALGALALFLVALCLIGSVLPVPPLVRWQCFLWAMLALLASRLVWSAPADLFRVLCPAWVFAAWAWHSALPAATSS